MHVCLSLLAAGLFGELGDLVGQPKPCGSRCFVQLALVRGAHQRRFGLLIASSALFWSPEAIASSTLRSSPRMRDRRALLIFGAAGNLAGGFAGGGGIGHERWSNLFSVVDLGRKSSGGEHSRRQRAAYSQRAFCRQ